MSSQGSSESRGCDDDDDGDNDASVLLWWLGPPWRTVKARRPPPLLALAAEARTRATTWLDEFRRLLGSLSSTTCVEKQRWARSAHSPHDGRAGRLRVYSAFKSFGVHELKRMETLKRLLSGSGGSGRERERKVPHPHERRKPQPQASASSVETLPHFMHDALSIFVSPSAKSLRLLPFPFTPPHLCVHTAQKAACERAPATPAKRDMNPPKCGEVEERRTRLTVTPGWMRQGRDRQGE